ncbi:MAG: hypothetical protein EHM45_00110 [Desulfobacteraceae bacterium]|nr:MAG: hypothetical protein EHM45_00110 [Desulfobacteraceae bacterium]
MEKAEVKFEKWIGEGFNLYKENFKVLLVPSLVAMLLSFTFILAGPMMAGMILITFALLDKKEPKPQLNDLFKGFDHFVQTLLFVLVWGIALFIINIVLGFIPCLGQILAIAVGLFASTALMFGLFLIVDKKMDFWAASLASFEKVKTNFFPFLGLAFIAGILGYIGVILCGIGLFLTLPLYFCIMSIAYREVFGSGASPTPPAGNA